MIIRIKRNSVRKNPDYGKGPQSVFEQVRSDVTFFISFLSIGSFKHQDLDKMISKFECRMTTFRMTLAPGDRLPVCEVEGYAYTPEHAQGLIDLFKSLADVRVKDSRIDIKNHFAEYNSIFEPSKYLYEYEDTKVKCSACGHEMSLGELESDYSDYDSDGSSSVCPKCDEWDCCEYEHENINDVLEEMGLE